MIMMITLGIVFSAIPSFIALDTFTQTQQQQEISQIEKAANDLMGLVSKEYEKGITNIKILSSINFLQDSSIPTKEKILFLKKIIENTQIFSQVSLYDNTGIKIGTTSDVGIGSNESDESFFKETMKGEIYYDKVPTFSQSLHANVIRFAAPLQEDQKIIGAIVGDIPVTKLGGIVKENSIQNGNVFVVTPNGKLIYAYPNYEGDILALQSLSIFRSLQASEKNMIKLIETNNGDENIFVGVKEFNFQQPSLDAYVIVSVPAEKAFSEVTDTRNNIIIAGLIILAASIVTILYFSQTISSPIEHLTSLTREVSKGKFRRINIKDTKDEIADLANSLNSMTDFLSKSQKENYELRNAMDESAIIAITDKNGVIIHVNQKFCAITKYSKDELIGQNYRIFRPARYPEKFYEEIWNTISSGHIWQGDIKSRAKDDTSYWVRTTIVPFLDLEGEPEQYIAISIDVTENYNYLQKLQEHEETINNQLQNLIEVDAQKSEFASMISHELKTPLFPILGYAEMLQKQMPFCDLKPDQLEAVNEIFVNAKRLEKLISDVLEVQKLEMRQLKFTKELINVTEFMRQVTKGLLPLVQPKNIEFVNSSIDVGMIIVSDRDRLIQVFTNLVQNAVDFVPKDSGKIIIDAKEFGEYVLFSVTDNGIGIPREEKPHLFKKFYQIDTSMARQHGGTGLGLAICKSIVEGLGGRIWFDSIEGSGTVFCFVIPKEAKLFAEWKDSMPRD